MGLSMCNPSKAKPINTMDQLYKNPLRRVQCKCKHRKRQVVYRTVFRPHKKLKNHKLYICMEYHVIFPNFSGITNDGRSPLIRPDPVYIHGMTGRSKTAAYEDSRGAPLVGVWSRF
jgi:hypothetical protein